MTKINHETVTFLSTNVIKKKRFGIMPIRVTTGICDASVVRRK